MQPEMNVSRTAESCISCNRNFCDSTMSCKSCNRVLHFLQSSPAFFAAYKGLSIKVFKGYLYNNLFLTEEISAPRGGARKFPFIFSLEISFSTPSEICGSGVIRR